MPRSSRPGEQTHGRHRTPLDGPSGAPDSSPGTARPSHSAAIAALLTETGPVPRDLRPPHPSAPIPVVRDARPPHPSGLIPTVGAPPMSAVRPDVTDDQIQTFLAQAAELRRATGPIPVPPPSVQAAPPARRPAAPVARPAAPAPRPAVPTTPPVVPTGRAAAPGRQGATPAPGSPLPAPRSATPAARPTSAPGGTSQARTPAGGAPASGRPATPAGTGAQDQHLREFSRPSARPTRAWSEPSHVAPQPVAPSSAGQDPWGTPLPVAATDVTRGAPAVPTTSPTFMELIRGDDIVRATPARPARQPREAVPRAASLLGRAAPDPSAPAGGRRGPSRAAGILGGIAVAMVGIAVLSVALPGRSTAVHPVGRVLAGSTVALTQADHAAKGTTSGSTVGRGAGAQEAASPHRMGSMLTAFAMPAPPHARVTPSMHAAMASGTRTSSTAAPSGSASPSASSSAPAAPAASAPAGASGLPAGAWNLKWSDEFSGTSLSSSRWTALNDSTFGDSNQQLECELASNATVSGGSLTLAARREQQPVTCGTHDSRFPGGRSYSGATIQTQGKADFTYGYFEVRAKVPMAPGTSTGLWPGFWLRPSDGGDGEIDVLETIGTPAGAQDAVHQTIHAGYTSGIPQQEHTAYYPSGSLSSAYHTYGVDWEPGYINWYIDGKLTYSRTTATTSWMQQDFSRPYFLRLNFAVGGNWPGSPDANTAFPASFDVDWVRVYQH